MARKIILRIEAVLLTPPSPRLSYVVADSGQAGGDLGGSFSLVAELKKSCILTTFEFCFLSLATQINYFF